MDTNELIATYEKDRKRIEDVIYDTVALNAVDQHEVDVLTTVEDWLGRDEDGLALRLRLVGLFSILAERLETAEKEAS